jgi:acetoin utilization protein AcuB
MTGTELGTLVTYNPLAVSLETTVERMIELVDQLHMHHFPVVDENQRLVGIVSETDILRAVRQQQSDTASQRPLRAEMLLSRDLVTIGTRATPREALQKILDHHIHSLPVLSDGRLLGIVTTSDFLREFSYGELPCSKEPVADHLPPAADPVDPDTPAWQALESMRESNRAHLAVVRGGCPIGLVSQVDIVRASCDKPAPDDDQTPSRSVATLMRRTPPLRPGQRLSEAAGLMVECQLPALVVTNQANRLMGVISDEDLLRVMLRQLK